MDAFGDEDFDVLRQKPPRPRRFCKLTTGGVLNMYRPRGMNGVILQVAEHRGRDLVEGNVNLIASVRSVKHWVSRWRRGLRVLRRRKTRMVLTPVSVTRVP